VIASIVEFWLGLGDRHQLLSPGFLPRCRCDLQACDQLPGECRSGTNPCTRNFAAVRRLHGPMGCGTVFRPRHGPTGEQVDSDLAPSAMSVNYQGRGRGSPLRRFSLSTAAAGCRGTLPANEVPSASRSDPGSQLGVLAGFSFERITSTSAASAPPAETLARGAWHLRGFRGARRRISAHTRQQPPHSC
jgi:hypothetical protein